AFHAATAASISARLRILQKRLSSPDRLPRLLQSPIQPQVNRIFHLWLCWSIFQAATAEPLVTEFMADNQTTAVDEDGEFSDWIEVHNPPNAALSLAGWSLTDTASDLGRWTFPDVTLEPGEFRIVWASNKNRRTADGPLHTNFALSRDGEYLALVRPE